MSESLHHIDQLFKDGAGDYTEAPAPANWDQLEQKLDKAAVADLRHKYRYWKRIAAAAILLLSLSAVALLTRQHRAETTPVVKEIPQPRQEQPAAEHQLPESKTADPGTGLTGTNPVSTVKTAPAVQQEATYAEPVIADSKNKTDKAAPVVDNATKRTLQKQQKSSAFPDAGTVIIKEEKSAPLTAKHQSNSTEQKKTYRNESIRPGLPKAVTPEKANAAIVAEESDYAAYAALKKAALLQQIRTAAVLEHTTVRTLVPLTATTAGIRNKWKSPLHRFSVGAFYAPQKISTAVAEGKPEHREDDHRKIKEEESISRSFEAGIQVSYRIKSNWQVLTGISYSTQQSTIQPKTVFARHDAGRGGPPGNPPPPGGSGDLRFKLNCAAGYVFLDPKASTAINFGDSLTTLRAENTLSYINIPVQTSYLFRKGRLEFGPVAGITTHILSKARLNTTLQESTGAKTPQTATINGLKKTYLSGMIGAQGIYNITDRFAVYVLPSTSFSLSPVNQNTPARTYLRQLGMQTGIRINL